ncbi:cupin domain-containing protein [Hydrogenophaga electricum]|uniref:Cupin n=1 Tax=Hydrogenophaga electricum TaxID=1230953 RepID=A0ABQ6C7X3_9BURK|nr:cupin domain-containing protein [Hydrogenophaga electricum]GLS16130.1 cupin [Hydrogenophaga electricum]
MRVRQVITGHNAQGKAIFTEDREVEASTAALMPGLGFHMLWSTPGISTFPDDGRESGSPSYFPPEGGHRFLIFTIPATREAPAPGTDLVVARADADRLLPGLLEKMEPDHPGMHRSDTIDFIYVLEGEIVLELDDGRETLLRTGDTAVQNGTRHAWRNRSGSPCRLLVCMAGARHQPPQG